MGLAQTKYPHIVINEKGSPIIFGKNIKVTQLVLEKTAYGWSPEELYFQHPYLTLGEIYSALAYYSDHQEKLDQSIEERLEIVDGLKQKVGTSPLVKRLQAKGLI